MAQRINCDGKKLIDAVYPALIKEEIEQLVELVSTIIVGLGSYLGFSYFTGRADCDLMRNY